MRVAKCIISLEPVAEDLQLALSVRSLADRFCIAELGQSADMALKYMLTEEGPPACCLQ